MVGGFSESTRSFQHICEFQVRNRRLSRQLHPPRRRRPNRLRIPRWPRLANPQPNRIHSNRIGQKPGPCRRQKPVLPDTDERFEIQKRHTLNWLIQGAAQHAGLTLHHLVRDELNALDDRLLQCYDEFALIVLLQYWRGMSALVIGRPKRFWDRASSDPAHPFFGHPLLPIYGGMLAEASKQHALNRCREKGYSMIPFVFSFKALTLLKRIRVLELPFRQRLLELAKQTAVAVWGIPRERFEVELSKEMPIQGDQFQADNLQARHLRSCIIGYSYVRRSERQLVVSAKGVTWQMLTKELVKGTAELISLHGLSQLQEGTYRRVIEAADRIEFEPWLLQSGGELWRRLLAALPSGCSLARALMRLARLPAEELHATLELVIRQAEDAGKRLSRLIECDGS